MARLFDAYIIADWTAAEGKKLGDQSVWIGVAKRDVRFRLYTETHNVATRAEGEALLASLLADHRKRGDRVLVGFDFNFGYPAGTAERLKLGETNTRRMEFPALSLREAIQAFSLAAYGERLTFESV